MVKPISLWSGPSGPNAWKVAVILEELQVPYEIKQVPFAALKNKPYTDLNPNGRTPTIEDPNTNITLWESGAIIQYLIEQYDPKHTISYASFKERHLCNQYLLYQVTGQGPYFGQVAWFTHLHAEKVQSAIDRYVGEVDRVLGVLDGVLEGRQWLVGDKMTFADLAFSTYNHALKQMHNVEVSPIEKLPNARAWQERMASRPSFKKVMQMRRAAMEAEGLPYADGSLPKGEAFEKLKSQVLDQAKNK